MVRVEFELRPEPIDHPLGPALIPMIRSRQASRKALGLTWQWPRVTSSRIRSDSLLTGVRSGLYPLSLPRFWGLKVESGDRFRAPHRRPELVPAALTCPRILVQGV